jgi:hypothetical protein
VAELLSPEAVTRTHQAAHHAIGALLARGQSDGSFRTDRRRPESSAQPLRPEPYRPMCVCVIEVN